MIPHDTILEIQEWPQAFGQRHYTWHINHITWYDIDILRDILSWLPQRAFQKTWWFRNWASRLARSQALYSQSRGAGKFQIFPADLHPSAWQFAEVPDANQNPSPKHKARAMGCKQNAILLNAPGIVWATTCVHIMFENFPRTKLLTKPFFWKARFPNWGSCLRKSKSTMFRSKIAIYIFSQQKHAHTHTRTLDKN
jgi:hypothetical protein